MADDARELRSVFRYLKRGVFPPAHVDTLTFGREAELAKIERELDIVGKGGTSHLFLEGAYGRGKSHFMKAIECRAARRGFAVSWVTLDGARHACNHPTRYLHALLENLRAPGTESRGLARLCRAWLEADNRDAIAEWARRSSAGWPSTPLNLMGTLGNSFNGQAGHLHEILESRDIVHRSGRDHFCEVSARLDATAELCRVAGLAGAVYLFDELETVATLLGTNRQRWLSYEFLNVLVDGRRHSNCMFVFAGTPDFGRMITQDYEINRCYAGAYPEGLRFAQKWREGSISTLRLRALGRADMVMLCMHLARLHSTAYHWNAESQFTQHFAEAFIVECEHAGLGVRDVVKAFVHLLEVSEQYRGLNIAESLGLAAMTTQSSGVAVEANGM